VHENNRHDVRFVCFFGPAAAHFFPDELVVRGQTAHVFHKVSNHSTRHNEQFLNPQSELSSNQTPKNETRKRQAPPHARTMEHFCRIRTSALDPDLAQSQLPIPSYSLSGL
jgi:hypothetical protein